MYSGLGLYVPFFFVAANLNNILKQTYAISSHHALFGNSREQRATTLKTLGLQQSEFMQGNLKNLKQKT